MMDSAPSQRLVSQEPMFNQKEVLSSPSQKATASSEWMITSGEFLDL